MIVARIGTDELVTNFTAMGAVLVAVALAIITVIPAFSREAQERAKQYAGKRYARQFKTAFLIVCASAVTLTLTSLIGVVALFFPSKGLAIMLGSLAGIGIIALGVGVIWIAMLVRRTVLK